MQILSNKKWLPVLMVLTIMAIAAFQIYWLTKAYEREERTLDMRTNFLFRETIYALQGSKLKLDRIASDSTQSRVLIQREYGGRTTPNQKVVNMVQLLASKAKDTGSGAVIIRGDDTLRVSNRNLTGRRNRLMQFLFDVDSVQDSVKVKEVETAYDKKLDENGINIPFTVNRIPTVEKEQPTYNEVTLGFAKPITYQLILGNKTPYLLKRILVPVLFSFFLVGFTFLSFTLLYRNLLRQRRLADIKNEFISNITHELKTPIATVSVAIEALRSFNASLDPQKTKEYLDISANELQRLSLLVDKVLKLSMFEKKEIDLKLETLSMQGLVEEVNSSMRLQFEKRGAIVHTSYEGDTTVEGDRLHLVSVIFNLLDNALKYSADKPEITLHVRGGESKVQLSIADRGCGIAPEYHHRVFEKFFRVPTGNLHNAKGYGLGLSYVSHVVHKHKGSISVSSEQGMGSVFTVTLPRQQYPS